MDPVSSLTLAAITYRGCELNLSDSQARKTLLAEIERCLGSFSPVKNDWRLAWGPAGFSPIVVGLDDSAMYVVRNLQDPSTLVIAIRGTNLFSLTDWLSNLLINQVPWPYGNPENKAGVRISGSTAIGLNILQTLSSEPPAVHDGEGLWLTARTWMAAAQTRFRYSLLNLTEHRTTAISNREIAASLSEWIQRASTADLPREISSIFREVDIGIKGFSASTVDPGSLLERVERDQRQFQSGIPLLGFLRAAVESSATPLNIHVVGHSKGGPLAAALALWLADTQGDSVPDCDVWDPAGHTKLDLYSFAAPTPGNSGFRDYFGSKIRNHYRLENPLDVIPHAWNVEEMNQVPEFYNGGLSFLQPLIDFLTPVLRELDFQHEVGAASWTDATPEDLPVIEQVVFQHLDAYLRRFNLLNGMSTKSLFTPLR
jgi:hypothetical protein